MAAGANQFLTFRLRRQALLFFNGTRYQLDAWVIMPNHVHVVVSPGHKREVHEIVHSWESFAAKQAIRPRAHGAVLATEVLRSPVDIGGRVLCGGQVRRNEPGESRSVSHEGGMGVQHRMTTLVSASLRSAYRLEAGAVPSSAFRRCRQSCARNDFRPALHAGLGPPRTTSSRRSSSGCPGSSGPPTRPAPIAPGSRDRSAAIRPAARTCSSPSCRSAP